jgi:osmotically-inducible protein OsmY
VNRVTIGNNGMVRALVPTRGSRCDVRPPHRPSLTSGVESDAMTEARARRQFASAPYPELRDVACDFRQGVLRLQGKVPTFYLKQMAITMARRIEGVFQVRDELRVPLVLKVGFFPRNES